MATQTEAQCQTEIKDRMAILQELRKAGSVNSSGSLSNYIAREQTALNDTEGDYTAASNVVLKAIRGLLGSTVQSAQAAALLDPLLLNYAKVVEIPDTDGPSILRRLYERFISSSLSVKARGITYGSISAGSNLGSGTINRLTVDAYGYNLEACHMETKRAQCFQDQTTGAEQQEEIFRIRGEALQPDQLLIDGSGIITDVRAMSSRQSLITNASFSQFAGDVDTVTDLSGWTLNSEVFANIGMDQTNYYRASGGLGDPTPTALRFDASDYIYQAFSFNNVQFNPDVPIYSQLAYNREVGSAAGTLIFTVGNVSVSVVLAAQTGWNILRIPLTKMLYPRNFANLNSGVVKVQFIRTSGTLLVDDICMGQMDQIDGNWIKIVGGATPFVAGNRDSFSWVDALTGSDSIIQQWLWRTYGLHLPYKTDATETWADPSV